jgi:hypothetical protein
VHFLIRIRLDPRVAYSDPDQSNICELLDKHFYTYYEGTNQYYLHPKLEVQRLTYPGQRPTAGNRTRAPVVGGEHSRKEPYEQLRLLLFGTSTVSFLKCEQNQY